MDLALSAVRFACLRIDLALFAMHFALLGVDLTLPVLHFVCLVVDLTLLRLHFICVGLASGSETYAPASILYLMRYTAYLSKLSRKILAYSTHRRRWCTESLHWRSEP